MCVAATHGSEFALFVSGHRLGSCLLNTHAAPARPCLLTCLLTCHLCARRFARRPPSAGGSCCKCSDVRGSCLRLHFVTPCPWIPRSEFQLAASHGCGFVLWCFCQAPTSAVWTWRSAGEKAEKRPLQRYGVAATSPRRVCLRHRLSAVALAGRRRVALRVAGLQAVGCL